MTEKRYKLKIEAADGYSRFKSGVEYKADDCGRIEYLTTAKQCAKTHPEDWEVIEVDVTPQEKSQSTVCGICGGANNGHTPDCTSYVYGITNGHPIL